MDFHTMMETEALELHDMELQLIEVLTFLGSKTQGGGLKDAAEDQLGESNEHAPTQPQICGHVGRQTMGRKSAMTRAMIQEAQEIIQGLSPAAPTDAFIIGAAQRAGHLEMTAFASAAKFCRRSRAQRRQRPDE